MTAFFIFIGGAILRVGMFLSDKSMWGDEWFSIDLAQRPLQQVVWGAIQDVHPPLYFVLLHGVVRFLGLADGSLRLISFLSGLGLLVAVFFLAKELFGKKESLVTLYLCAISPYWLQSSNEVRSYALFAFVTCLGSLFLARTVKRPELKKWGWAYTLTASTTVTIEHYAWFWLAAATVYFVWLFFKEGQGGRLIVYHRSALFLASPSLILVGYQALYREGVFNFERIKEYLPLAVLGKKVLGIFWHLACGYTYSMLTVEQILAAARRSPLFWLSALTTFFALGLVLRGLCRLFKKSRSMFIFFLTVFFVPVVFLAAFYSIRLDARYLAFAAPFYFLLLALGVWESGRWIRVSFLVLYTFISLTGSIRAIQSPTDMIHKEDYKRMIAYVLESASEKDAVCGLVSEADYYQKVWHQKFKGVYFAFPDEFFSSQQKDFERVWIMDHVNMHARVTGPHLEKLKKRMDSAGFSLAGEPMRFGGDEALTQLYIFIPRGAHEP